MSDLLFYGIIAWCLLFVVVLFIGMSEEDGCG